MLITKVAAIPARVEKLIKQVMRTQDVDFSTAASLVGKRGGRKANPLPPQMAKFPEQLPLDLPVTDKRIQRWMYQDSPYRTHKKASFEETTFKSGSRLECERIMDRIYGEDKSLWPYGLSTKGLDGGTWMIREASTQTPVGFCGWQERKEAGEKVGYYAIGILPEYRGQGYAKEAVKKLIEEKSSSVDRVKAFIMPHNQPSLELAKTLGVEIIHR